NDVCIAVHDEVGVPATGIHGAVDLRQSSMLPEDTWLNEDRVHSGEVRLPAVGNVRLAVMSKYGCQARLLIIAAQAVQRHARKSDLGEKSRRRAGGDEKVDFHALRFHSQVPDESAS